MILISYHRSQSTLGYDWFVYSDYYQMAGWIDHPIINYRLVSKSSVVIKTINLRNTKEIFSAGGYEK